MRLPSLLLVAAVALAAPGCEWLNKSRNPLPKLPAGPMTPRQPEELVGYLNAQAGYLRTVSYADVRLAATDNGRSMPALTDTSLFAAQPRNFRLIAGTFATSQEIDLGSNDREFWMYVKRLNDPNFFFCSHADFAAGTARFPIPFDPDWVMMALGMTPYDATGRYTVEVNNREQAYVLTQQTQTRQGQPVSKSTVFNADWDEGRRPVVRGHIVKDAAGQKICSAEVKAAKTLSLGTDPTTGKTVYAQVPSHVVLEWPQQKFVMDLRLGGEKVNEDFAERTAGLFTLPKIPGSNAVDLAQYQFPAARGQVPGERRK